MNCEKALEIAQNAQSFGNFLGIICIILFVFMIFFWLIPMLYELWEYSDAREIYAKMFAKFKRKKS